MDRGWICRIVAANISSRFCCANMFNYSIPDSFDIGRLLLGILIFWGIAATSYRGGPHSPSIWSGPMSARNTSA